MYCIKLLLKSAIASGTDNARSDKREMQVVFWERKLKLLSFCCVVWLKKFSPASSTPTIFLDCTCPY